MADIDVFGEGNLSVEERRELVRRHLQNLITSYSDEADIFTEIIQNGIDALSAQLGRTDERPTLTVVLGRRRNEPHYLYVQDNGTGMKSEDAQRLCIPGFSTGKVRGRTIGYKGVGASYVAAVSSHFAVWTIDASGHRTERTIRHAHNWVTDPEAPPPTVTESFEAPALVDELRAGMTRGTGVYYQFHAGHKPERLDNLVRVGEGPEVELKYWVSFLAARTPVGEALGPEMLPSIPNCDIRVMLDLGDGVQLDDVYQRSSYDMDRKTVGYPFPDQVFKVSKDVAEIDADGQVSSGRQFEKNYLKHQAIHQTWKGPEFVEKMTNLDDDESALLMTHLEWVRGYLCHSTDTLKRVNRMLGGRGPLVRYGARLTVEGVPQGRALDLALTSDQGLDRQTHIVLGFKQLELDTGRKFISDEKILSAVAKVNQRVVSKLKDYRQFLKKELAQPFSSDLTQWIADVESRRLNSIVPALLKRSSAGSALSVDPGSENDVIALWGGLMASNALPGYEMVAISGFNRYDALINIRQEALEGQSEVDPLGVLSTEIVPKMNAVLEFKLDFADLIKDFESNVKIPSEIDLLVCWDTTELNLRRGALRPVYGPDWRHHRPARGVSYVWTDDNSASQIMVIALRNLAAELLAADGDDGGRGYLAVLTDRDGNELL